MVVGDVIGVVCKVVELLYNRRENWLNNKAECKLLREFADQAESHMPLIDGLEKKLETHQLDSVKKLLGTIKAEYGLLLKWLKREEANIRDFWRGFRNAPDFERQLLDWKTRIDTTVNSNFLMAQLVVSFDNRESQIDLGKGVRALIFGQDALLRGQERLQDNHNKFLGRLDSLCGGLQDMLKGQVEDLRLIIQKGQKDTQHIVDDVVKQLAAKQLKPPEDQEKAASHVREEIRSAKFQIDATILDPSWLSISGEFLGRGSHGVVKGGTLQYCGKAVEIAAKTINVSSAGSSSARQGLMRELEKIKAANLVCSSAYVCRFYGLCEKDGEAFLVMQRYKTSLEQHLQKQLEEGSQDQRGGLSVREACDIGRRVAVGLKELHEASFLHLDIKPGNILLDEANNAVLADFSCSKHLKGTTYVATRGAVGTTQYMAPECAFQRKYGERRQPADVWSFAGTLLHMLTGKLPWLDTEEEALHDEEVYGLLMEGDEAAGPTVPEDLPGGLSSLLKRCFSFQQALRPPLTEIIEGLTQVLDSELRQPAAAPPAVPEAPPTPKSSAPPPVTEAPPPPESPADTAAPFQTVPPFQKVQLFEKAESPVGKPVRRPLDIDSAMASGSPLAQTPKAHSQERHAFAALASRLQGGEPESQRAAIRSLRERARGSEDMRSSEDVIPSLVALLRSGSTETQKEAVRLVELLARDNAVCLEKEGAVPVLVALKLSGPEGESQLALDCIMKMCANPEAREAVVGSAMGELAGRLFDSRGKGRVVAALGAVLEMAETDGARVKCKQTLWTALLKHEDSMEKDRARTAKKTLLELLLSESAWNRLLAAQFLSHCSTRKLSSRDSLSLTRRIISGLFEGLHSQQLLRPGDPRKVGLDLQIAAARGLKELATFSSNSFTRQCGDVTAQLQNNPLPVLRETVQLAGVLARDEVCCNNLVQIGALERLIPLLVGDLRLLAFEAILQMLDHSFGLEAMLLPKHVLKLLPLLSAASSESQALILRLLVRIVDRLDEVTCQAVHKAVQEVPATEGSQSNAALMEDLRAILRTRGLYSIKSSGSGGLKSSGSGGSFLRRSSRSRS